MKEYLQAKAGNGGDLFQAKTLQGTSRLVLIIEVGSGVKGAFKGQVGGLI